LAAKRNVFFVENGNCNLADQKSNLSLSYDELVLLICRTIIHQSKVIILIKAEKALANFQRLFNAA
jgi:hypothetical protein